MTRFALIHGAATGPSVYDAVVTALTSADPRASVRVPARPSSGDLFAEVAAVRDDAHGRVVGGVSGGATLGLALLSAGVPLAGAVLHEPAAGSLVPGLLDAVAAAYRSAGVAGFAQTLYGDAWQPALAPADPQSVARDLAMFRAFEPLPPVDAAVPVLITVGERSAPIRHTVAHVLADRFGYDVRVIPGCGHAVHLEAPDAFATLLMELATRRDRGGAARP